jgi:hypothetical protein
VGALIGGVLWAYRRACRSHCRVLCAEASQPEKQMVARGNAGAQDATEEQANVVRAGAYWVSAPIACPLHL